MIVVSIEVVFESYVAKGYQAVRCLYVLRAPTSYKLAFWSYIQSNLTLAWYQNWILQAMLELD
jgi:hypothetical protein